MDRINRCLRLTIGCVLIGTMTMCTTESLSEKPQNIHEQIAEKMEQGEYTLATQAIHTYLKNENVDLEQRKTYLFELERMERVRQDFTAKPEAVLDFIRKYYPGVNEVDIARWEASRALEVKIIDGEKLYFNHAARNLFRIDQDMQRVWEKQHPEEEITSGSGATLDLDAHNAKVIQASIAMQNEFVLPVRMAIKHSIEVKADVLPAGEIIKCWIPYPRLIPGRQEHIKLIQTAPAKNQLAPEGALQRTVYLEKMAVSGQPTRFSVEYELSSHAVYHDINPDAVTELKNPELLQEYLGEEPPHILFTPEMRKLSRDIIGSEINPYRKAQLLFAWIDEHTPWASAREYSSIRCIPQYALENGHGDCGIQTLFFITLCRMNGIPARWQSGWELQPPHDSMHDWGMIYFEPYGWVPMDITYGLRKSEDPRLHWFYLGGMDSFRIIFNDGWGETFIPQKTYIRSETVDSQRGELEGSERNLYFDEWNWKFEWDIL